MFFNHVAVFRCPRELDHQFKEFIKDKIEIENYSHGVRIAMIKYMREYKRPEG